MQQKRGEEKNGRIHRDLPPRMHTNLAFLALSPDLFRQFFQKSLPNPITPSAVKCFPKAPSERKSRGDGDALPTVSSCMESLGTEQRFHIIPSSWVFFWGNGKRWSDVDHLLPNRNQSGPTSPCKESIHQNFVGKSQTQSRFWCPRDSEISSIIWRSPSRSFWKDEAKA